MLSMLIINGNRNEIGSRFFVKVHLSGRFLMGS